jgi:hypothetical protein
MITFKGNTGCDEIKAMADRITDAKGKDRRILDDDMRALMRDIARRAAQAAARAALEGEI